MLVQYIKKKLVYNSVTFISKKAACEEITQELLCYNQFWMFPS